MEFSQSRTKRLQKRLSMFLFYILVAYVLLLAFALIFERRMIFFPNYPGRLEGDWHPRTLGPEDVWISATDGTKLHAWWIPNTNAKFTFLAFQGNASNIANRAPAYEFLRDTPANVLAVEYRGYGHSEGKPSEAGFYIDAEAAYQYLVKTRSLDPKSIVSYGQSLGTAVAVDLAAHHSVGGVILEAPFPSASRVASKIFWFLPGLSLLVHSQFDTQSKLKQISAPTLVVHCDQDPVLPFQFGQEVYNSARSPKYFLQINGYCHEEQLPQGVTKQYSPQHTSWQARVEPNYANEGPWTTTVYLGFQESRPPVRLRSECRNRWDQFDRQIHEVFERGQESERGGQRPLGNSAILAPADQPGVTVCPYLTGRNDQQLAFPYVRNLSQDLT